MSNTFDHSDISSIESYVLDIVDNSPEDVLATLIHRHKILLSLSKQQYCHDSAYYKEKYVQYKVHAKRFQKRLDTEEIDLNHAGMQEMQRYIDNLKQHSIMYRENYIDNLKKITDIENLDKIPKY